MFLDGSEDWLDVESEEICTRDGPDTWTCLKTGFSISFDTDEVDVDESLSVVDGDSPNGTILAAVCWGVADEAPVVR